MYYEPLVGAITQGTPVSRRSAVESDPPRAESPAARMLASVSQYISHKGVTRSCRGRRPTAPQRTPSRMAPACARSSRRGARASAAKPSPTAANGKVSRGVAQSLSCGGTASLTLASCPSALPEVFNDHPSSAEANLALTHVRDDAAGKGTVAPVDKTPHVMGRGFGTWTARMPEHVTTHDDLVGPGSYATADAGNSISAALRQSITSRRGAGPREAKPDLWVYHKSRMGSGKVAIGSTPPTLGPSDTHTATEDERRRAAVASKSAADRAMRRALAAQRTQHRSKGQPWPAHRVVSSQKGASRAANPEQRQRRSTSPPTASAAMLRAAVQHAKKADAAEKRRATAAAAVKRKGWRRKRGSSLHGDMSRAPRPNFTEALLARRESESQPLYLFRPATDLRLCVRAPHSRTSG